MDDPYEAIRKLVAAFNSINEVFQDDLNTGISKNEIWLLYALSDGIGHSQTELCAGWGFPKSTVNSTVKRLEKIGYLQLKPFPGQQRQKAIQLTTDGRAFAQKILTPFWTAENTALRKTAEKFSDDFVDAMSYFASCIKDYYEAVRKE